MTFKRYRKKEPLSYSLGAFPTIELVNNRQDLVEVLLISEKLENKEKFTNIFDQKGITWRIDDKSINRISNKDNVFIAGVFRKELKKAENSNHLVCDNISDMGNLGNIMRTMLAMGIYDLITIGNACDLYNPKTVRASMGAIFHIRHSNFNNYEEYLKKFPAEDRESFMFMLDKEAMKLSQATQEYRKISETRRWSLVFGNEGSGLDRQMLDYGKAVYIEQSEEVDSLNLTTAVAIGLYEFCRERD